ncbi:MAG: penicillin-binding protein activator [Candidatus Eutrophobiaceae bacterium]
MRFSLKGFMPLLFLLLPACGQTPGNFLNLDKDHIPVSEQLAAEERLQAAEIALQNNKIELAKTYLGNAADLSEDLQIRYWDIKAQIENLNNQPLTSLETRFIQLQAARNTEWEEQTAHELWLQLCALPEETLYRLHESASAERASWLTLTLYWKTLEHRPQTLAEALRSWATQHQGHPATVLLPDLLANVAEQKIERIALFLPSNPDLADVAAAVLEGFLAAWYESPATQRPKIDIHYTNTENVGNAWQLATNAGASYIVGPLEKPVIIKLLEYADDRIPILSLNHIDRSIDLHGVKLTQIGLGAEEEVEQIAEYAWFSGHQRALIFVSNNAWGQRAMHTFYNRWEALGGTVVGQQSYAIGEKEYSLAVKQLLRVDAGEVQRQRLQSVIGATLEGSIWSRKDVDFIFLASLPQEGRLIMPQLRYFRAGHIPVFSTSLIYSGTPNPDEDRDLNDLRFVDIPWMLPLNRRHSLTRQKLNDVRGATTPSLRRLHALGIDAYQILPELTHMEKQNSYTYSGEIGDLSMTQDGRIHRRLLWAQFINGQPTQTSPASELE